MNKVYYFAYGSNLNETQLIERGIFPKSYFKASLKNYELSFNKISKDGTGKANITSKKNSIVWGACYLISEIDFQQLLANYEIGYDSIILNVYSLDDKKIEALGFIAEIEKVNSSLKPSQKYLQTIIDGALDHKLPEDYLKFLSSFDTMSEI